MAASIQIVSPTPETPYNVAPGTYRMTFNGIDDLNSNLSVRRYTEKDLVCSFEVSKAGKSYIYIM